MPRVRQPTGGLRPGSPGQPYPNRSDLARQPNLPARVATGQTYGKAQQQMQAQRTVPMAPPPTLIPPPAPGVGAAGLLSGLAPTPAVPPAGPEPPAPGGFGPLDRYTERPGEPVTQGAPIGAGAGPEALIQSPISPESTQLSAMLAQIARSSGSAALQALAAHAAANGQ